MGDRHEPDIGVMVDIESLALGPDCYIVSAAFVPFELAGDDRNNPFPPSLKLRFNPGCQGDRMITPSTVAWWLGRDDEARLQLAQDLTALGDSVTQSFDDLAVWATQVAGVNGGTPLPDRIQWWAKGPQFDMVALESLGDTHGRPCPWDYNLVCDLRTLMATVQLHTKDVPEPEGFIFHDPIWDCKYQIQCYYEAMALVNQRVG